MRKYNRTRKRLRLTPLILGSYAAFLGFGLVMIGLTEIKEWIGIVRLLIGTSMAGFGLLGIWDGVRDLIKPDKKSDPIPAIQFILTDASGNRSSLVTPEVIEKQIDILTESEEHKPFDIRILPPLPAGEHGALKQILCIYHGDMIMAAFFETPQSGYQICQKITEPEMASKWLKQLLAGSPDFSGWDNIQIKTWQNEGDFSQNQDAAMQGQDTSSHSQKDAIQDESVSNQNQDAAVQGQDTSSHNQENPMQVKDASTQDKEQSGWSEADALPGKTTPQSETLEAFWRRLLTNQKGQMAHWHQLLTIFGESWHDVYKFFSARDVALAIEGIHEGKYLKAVLEWGGGAVELFPGVQNDLMVIWRANQAGTGKIRYLAKTGTVTQVKFWLAGYLDYGLFKELNGWTDITKQMEKADRKEKKKHGNLF